MEGITDPWFRYLVSQLGAVGGACTDFVRVSGASFGTAPLRKRLGPIDDRVPTGVQIMISDTEFLSETIANAEAVGAAFIDLNFGCPAPKVFNNCAGSAMLDKPELLLEIVRAAVTSTDLPVSVKMRPGVADDANYQHILGAVAEAGAAMVAVHGRLRIHTYAQPSQWHWIRDGVQFVKERYPQFGFVGNGSIRTGADAYTMMSETGCDAVMVGIGSLANPWVFNEMLGSAATVSWSRGCFCLALLVWYV